MNYVYLTFKNGYESMIPCRSLSAAYDMVENVSLSAFNRIEISEHQEADSLNRRAVYDVTWTPESNIAGMKRVR
jgi:hypothetical protein